MREIVNEIRRAAEATVGVGPDTKAYIGAAIARALATILTLPTSPVKQGQLRAWYHENNGELVGEVISQINEVMIIDVREVSELTYKFFSLRYDVVHQPDEDRAMRLMEWLSVTDEDAIPPRTREVLSKGMASDDEALRRNMPNMLRSVLRTMRPLAVGEVSEAE